MSWAGVRERCIKPVDTEEPGLDSATHEHGGPREGRHKTISCAISHGWSARMQCYETPSRVYGGRVLSLVCLITFSALVDIDVLAPLKKREMALSMPNPWGCTSGAICGIHLSLGIQCQVASASLGARHLLVAGSKSHGGCSYQCYRCHSPDRSAHYGCYRGWVVGP